MFLRRDHFVVAAVISIACLAVFIPRETAAVSCGGASHALTLSSGTVSPGSGWVDDRFTFSVTYADNNGCTPERIVVIVSGVGEFALNFDAGDLQTGATFVRRLRLPAGTWPYRFEAVSGTGVGKRTATLINVSPPYAVVMSPTPPPTPKPQPTQQSTPKPTPGSSTAPTATAAPSAPTTVPPPTLDPGHDQTPEAPPASAVPIPASGEPVTAPPPSSGPSPVPDAASGIDARVGPAGPNLPQPVQALLLSSLGTIVGLGVFLVIGRRLVDPEPSRAASMGERSMAWPDVPERDPR